MRGRLDLVYKETEITNYKQGPSVKFTIKTYVFISLIASTSIAGQVYYPATECPLLKDNPQAVTPVTSVAVIAPLETSAITPISNTSQPKLSPLRDGLTASPPFEAPESIGKVTAGEGVATAPSRATPTPAPIITASVQTEVARTDAKPATPAEMIPEMTKDTPRSGWDAVLSKYVKAPDAAGLARFDYAGLKASSADIKALDSYIKTLEDSGSGILSENEIIAYWANLYNAVTIQVVTEAYPVSTIKKVRGGVFKSGPWKQNLITVSGEKMSLDDVEHKTLRAQYPSPLIHYMVNCASIGCPNLKAGVWKASTLEVDRKAAARAYINSPRGARVTDKGLVVSSIYDWFEEDFGGDKAGVIAHLSKYAEGDLKAALDGGITISGYDYDWSLNE